MQVWLVAVHGRWWTWGGEGADGDAGDRHRDAVMNGAVRRLRPKLMTAATMCVGLVPLLWATGTGADVMKRVAAPLVGGNVTSFLLELLIYPRSTSYGGGTLR